MGNILVSNLGKAYKQYPNRWARLAEWILPSHKPRHQLHWVLQGINFAISPGEAVGIIGINGAGKSTLLKLITGTAQATTGSVHISGRVAALLELGMGFHPDFSGRQNVLMAGQLLGHSVAELIRLMPEIEAFAEIGEYIDQPVRTYSSGMQMRLAFSVATAHRPDVLIVDEALSVGDTHFQHKSFERIRQFAKAGTTLLIVSHDKAAIQSICTRAILLDQGSVALEGEPETIMDFYNALIAERKNTTVTQKQLRDGRVQTVSGTNEANVIKTTLLNAAGVVVETVNVGEILTLCLSIQIHQPLPRMIVGYLIKDRLGQTIYGTNTHHMDKPLNDVNAGDSVEYHFTFPANLGPGHYSITTALTDHETHLGNNYEWRDLALLFTVVNIDKPIFTGCTWLEPRITLHRNPHNAG
ncbi:ABC transporter ATP-binding protein [Thiothrix unzii]|jgi:lipopolysaccharide transport system ATP-binding protein|uniref:ABC transporter ATP-binding protein n=1 Tax=Thiothrix unzii TaxID=111769 RepID=A0A975F7T2_9GAMM|nr:ABC transporter ATP-binding protein [Thiothrix unzii]QTR52591.1 ABC transporter ATP-binding protein [Thiothrix unzii]